MRPRSPRVLVTMVNGNMQYRNLIWKTTLGSHDINVTTEEARNASEGRISQDLAHDTVMSWQEPYGRYRRRPCQKV